MASGEPSPCLMKQIQLTICQICGRNMGHSSREAKVNYQKQVDEPRCGCDSADEGRIPHGPVPHPKQLFPEAEPLITHTPTIEYRVTSEPYTQIIPDYRYDEDEASLKKIKKGVKDECGKKNSVVHVCVPYPITFAVQQQTSAPAKVDTKPSAKDQSAGKECEKSATTKAACLPVGGSCPPPVKMMLCLPCPPPETAMANTQSQQPKKPKDYTYRCESRELRGGNLYHCCQCNKRNGLQHDCPRTPCQGRPACLVKPWPDCWPSGGCHGIDYSRENGVKRYDPCSEQRFDKKECRPSGNQPKADCGGNMMIVVCPPPQPNC